jgi:membrane protease YdiL (CAAX protease family)
MTAPMETSPQPATTSARPNLVRRIARYPLVQAFTGVLMVVLAIAVASAASEALGVADGAYGLAGAILVAIAVVGAWKLYKRWIEREPDREFALKAVPELAVGLVAGIVLFCLVTGAVWLLGGIRFEGLRSFPDTQFARWAAIAVISGFFEETLFRGLLFRAIEKVSGSWIALAVTSAFFGLSHIFNPDATWFAALAIAVEAGILLGAAYMLTRRLWLAVGLHAAWNFTQGWLFSVPVSGGGSPIGLIRTVREGPEWLTGGDFGLEASLVAMVVVTAVGLGLLWWAHRRGSFVAAPWRRGQTKL